MNYLLLFAAGKGNDRGKSIKKNSILKEEMIMLSSV